MRVSCTVITARTLFMIFTGKNRESKRSEIESQVVERIRANKSFDVEINKAEFKRNNKKMRDWKKGEDTTAESGENKRNEVADLH